MTAATPECGDIEASLVRLWERNLGVPVSPTDDYFGSGGDSLRGTQLLAWIQESFGVELSLLDLFESRTPGAQSRLLRDRLDRPDADNGTCTTEYFFFGPQHEHLLGALHRPASHQRKTGVVACYPTGQEYMRIHRTYVELARRLAASGCHVLRFDYFGCGDSAGETRSGDLRRWIDDIRLAVRELRLRAAMDAVYLVGARVGANLALDASSEIDVAGVVVWEPILDGAEYVASLEHAHQRLLHGNAELNGYQRHSLRGLVGEHLGFPLTSTLRDQLTGLKLGVEHHPTLVLANTHKPALESYATRRPGTVYVSTGESDGIWLNEDRQNKGVIPARAVQEIVAWIARRDA